MGGGMDQFGGMGGMGGMGGFPQRPGGKGSRGGGRGMGRAMGRAMGGMGGMPSRPGGGGAELPDELLDAFDHDPLAGSYERAGRLVDESILHGPHGGDGDDVDVDSFEDVSDDPLPPSPMRAGLSGHLRSRAAARERGS
mmetsp:Transcript_37976/g.99620  ORF Transcript_37976/g.99620 Transcript_37976/m.99620 type:complete len:139 (+) Transcript_37976:3-419(+)